jgi:hypothetical protein
MGLCPKPRVWGELIILGEEGGQTGKKDFKI